MNFSYAPWSNSYETMVYVGWATVFAGLLFVRRSTITFALATLFGGIILFVSGLNWMDPEINPLVPVLKSPWLMFHVAVIVAAYGFFGISCLIGLTNMVMMSIAGKKNKEILKARITELSIVGEMALWVGLALMTVGTFLGAVWANESWGRYWGWDPKETWALITMVVYAVVTHLHLVKRWNSLWLFNLASVIAFASVLMTFFGVYRPAAQNDEKQLARLMNLYRTLYRIVALAVLGIGLALMPFLPLLMKGGEGIENLQLIYLLYLLQAVTSYLLSYKNAIYQAYQKAYIRKALDQIIGIVRLILQIVVLVTTRNFILYLIIQLFVPMVSSVIISIRADREFPYLKQYKELPEPQERKAIFKNVGALSLHKLATVIVRSTDNLIMSAFDGLATVGIYSNYKLVLMNVNNLLGHVTGAFTASIGNLNALEGRKRVYEIFRILDFAAFLLYGYLSGGLVTLINFFIRMIFGEEYLFSMTVVVIIIAEFFISGLRQMGLQFREALGLFWHDRYKALAEAIINLVVSLILVRRFGVAGIIGGTIISSLLTCVWFEPYVLMRYGIEEDCEAS